MWVRAKDDPILARLFSTQAGFWIRLVAFGIDFLLLIMFDVILFSVSFSVTTAVVSLILWLVYVVVMPTTKRQDTVGKKLMKIKIVGPNDKK